MKVVTLILATLLLQNSVSFSQAGSLDSNFFGTNGKVIKPAGSANAVAIAPDGKIVAGGHSATGFTLVRYTVSGTIDKSFGVNGIATADFGDGATVGSIVIKPSGKIIAVGGMGNYFLVAKFNANGSLDSSFGTNGKVTTRFVSNAMANYVTVDPDNNILVVGTGYEFSGVAPQIRVTRYKPDGTPDSSFNHTGKLTVHAPGGTYGEGCSAILQPNGKIIVIGSALGDYGLDFMLARYYSNGTLDTGFGTNGFTLTDFKYYDVAFAGVKQSNDNIVVAGYSRPYMYDYFLQLARYKNGKLDSSFGVNGKIIKGFHCNRTAAIGLAIQKDDKIIVAGAGDGMAITRFTKNGKPDSSFGGDGSVNIDSLSDEYVSAVALQKNEKIIAAGGSLGKFLVCRLRNDNAIANTTGISPASKAGIMFPNARLYPNPATNIIYINGIPKGAILTMYDEQGTALKQGSSGNGRYSFNIQQLPAGAYYIQCISQGKLIAKLNFIKQR